ncbi:MAG: tetratricopeptide repeat protein [Muribaculaceae bacterium]|nr:tetratricopeptide repeat protein [Muribaculaceae bacterium]
MKSIRFIIFLIAVSVASLSARSQEPTIGMADSAYNSGNYRRAIEAYNAVAETQGVSAPLLFNLGNAYLQDGDYGNAMLSYQRAHKLDPSNKRIKTNLAYLTGKVEDANKAEQKGKRKKVTEDTPNFFQSVNTTISRNTSSNTWAAWAAGSFLLFSGCVCLYLFSSNVMLRKTGFFGGFILLGISMVTLVCAYAGAAEAESHDYGVVVAYKAMLQTEPSQEADSEKNEGVLTRGTTVRIISEETDAEGRVNWYKVRLNSDYIGWLEAKDVTVF